MTPHEGKVRSVRLETRTTTIMASIAYLIRTELKKNLGDAPEDSKTCLIVPPPENKLNYVEAADKAFDLVIAGIRESTRYSIIEESFHRRVSVDDLRPLRNSLMFEKEGWRCFSIRG
jgi:hypothetical protein